MEIFMKDEPLPHFAAKTAKQNHLVPFQQLFTKNGMKHGNAMIVRIIDVSTFEDGRLNISYEIVTDSDNWITLTHSELLDAFTPGMYVLRDFVNPDSKRNFMNRMLGTPMARLFEYPRDLSA
jgi:hypothetical protein